MSPYRGFLPPDPPPTRWRVLRAAAAFGLGWALGDRRTYKRRAGLCATPGCFVFPFYPPYCIGCTRRRPKVTGVRLWVASRLRWLLEKVT